MRSLPSVGPLGARRIIMAADKTFKVAIGESTNPLTEDLAIKANTCIRVVVMVRISNLIDGHISTPRVP